MLELGRAHQRHRSLPVLLGGTLGLALACFDPYAEPVEANALCGNGELDEDEGEECDDGEDNSNQGACKSDCTAQVCGDGFVGPGELCDDGPDCTLDCTLMTCGNGEVDEGEECDDGNDSNADDCSTQCVALYCGDDVTQEDRGEECDDGNDDDTDGCTNSCLIATCGDNITQAGEEECDDGNDDNTDGCVEGCKLATCGDGFVQAGEEECDPLDDAACGDSCVLEYRQVFVTSEAFSGDLGGLEGADAICQAEAEANGLKGTYYAWLSTSESAPAGRFIQSEIPYGLVNGGMEAGPAVAADWDDLTDGWLQNAINRGADGMPTPYEEVWTGTDEVGLIDGFEEVCSDWSTDGAEWGRTGLTGATNDDWSAGYNDPCSMVHPFYCFRQ